MGVKGPSKALLPRRGDFEIERAPTSTRRKILIIVAIVLVASVVVAGIALSIYYRTTDNVEVDIAKSLQVENILGHLTTLNSLADTVGHGSRSVVDAYNASAEYVVSQLEEADFCDVQRQYFQVPIYVQLAPPTLMQTYPYNISYVLGRDFSGTRYGGNGNYSFEAEAVVADNLGCTAIDFSTKNFTDRIAVVFDGNCTQYQKALNAELASAKAILIVNAKGNALANWRVRSIQWNDSTPLVQIPVFSLTYSLGLTFLAQETTLHITAATRTTIEETYNVLCLTKKGSPESILVMGAHLDSVPEGPGINDNGSGSSSVLEVALEIARTDMEITNKILFAWWGAEEIGLMGSRYFVNQILLQSQPNGSTPFDQVDFLPSLSDNNTLLGLNFDMLGSPNYVRYVYTSAPTATPIVNAASFKIQEFFEEYFNQSELAYQLTPMGGGSDYLPFVENGIPAGALATGAGSLKTVNEREIFGGFANAAYDPCYHLSCDTTSNIDEGVLEDMAKGAAYVVQKLAQLDGLLAYLYDTA